MSKLYVLDEESAILDKVRAGQSQEEAEKEIGKLLIEKDRSIFPDDRFYVSGNNELITTAEFVTELEADYGIKFIPIMLG